MTKYIARLHNWQTKDFENDLEAARKFLDNNGGGMILAQMSHPISTEPVFVVVFEQTPAIQVARPDTKHDTAILDWIEHQLRRQIGGGRFWDVMHEVHRGTSNLRDYCLFHMPVYKRRKIGDRVWVAPGAGFGNSKGEWALIIDWRTNEDAELTPCQICPDAECREFGDLVPDRAGVTFYHVSECQMFDGPQEQSDETK